MRGLLFPLFAGLTILFSLESAHAQAQTPPFTEAPAIGNDTSAGFLLIIENQGSLRVLTDTNMGPYDGSDDTLIGVLNLSTNAVASIPLRGYGYNGGIFAFDGDGICTFSNAPAGCPFGPTGYEGPGVSFANISADQTGGVVNFNPPIPAANGTAYFSLENAIITQCPPITAGTNYKQCDSRWGTNRLGAATNADTICSMGCYLTSTAMLINYQAANQGVNFNTDPLKLNNYLLTNGGFVSNSGAVSAQGVLVIAQYARAHGVNLYYAGMIGKRDDFTLDQYLCNQQPPLVYVGGHWVFPTGQTTVNAIPSYSVLDPDSYPNGGTLQGWNYTYLGMDLFTSTQQPLSGLYVTAHSPVALLLTDPNGAQTGVDLANNTPVSSIPLSGYQERFLTNSPGDTNDPTLPSTPPLKFLTVVGATNGEYNLTVVGTNTGPYEVDFVAYDTNGTPSSQTAIGMASPGSFATFKATYSSSSGVPVSLTLVTNTITQTAPAGSNVYFGGEVELCLSGAVSGGLSYQWTQNGLPLSDEGLIAGSQTPCLTLGGAAGSNQFRVETITDFGSSTSQVFSVSTVLPSTLPFAKGTYAGLFFPGAGVSATNSGLFKLLLTAQGKFTGSLRFARGTAGFSGKFNADGTAGVTAKLGTEKLMVGLQVDTTPGSDRIVGTITNGTMVTAIYAFLDGKCPATPVHGAKLYTMALPGGTNDVTSPVGWSTMTGSLSAAGNFSVSATLADGTQFSQSMSAATTGIYPLFQPLYAGKGLMIGWLQLTNDTVSGDSIIWIKPAGLPGQKYFKDGFIVEGSIVASPYVKPAPKTDAVTLTNNIGDLVLAYGNLGGTITNVVELIKDKATFLPDLNKTAVTLNPNNGDFTGSFVPPGTKRKETFSGVVLQQHGMGFGWFLGTNASGSVILESIVP